MKKRWTGSVIFHCLFSFIFKRNIFLHENVFDKLLTASEMKDSFISQAPTIPWTLRKENFEDEATSSTTLPSIAALSYHNSTQ